jgi:hypothetical protein
MPVARITYVFLRPGVERSPGDPAALAAAAASRLGARPESVTDPGSAGPLRE